MKHHAGSRSAASGVLGEARGRVLAELCGQPRTATELARRVNTTANAVRAHLESLAEAGLVEYAVERRGVGKPTHVYSLTADAEYLLSKAYAPVLGALVGTLREAMNGQFLPTLRRAGEAFGRATLEPSSSGGVEAARRFLQAIGGSSTRKKTPDGVELRTACCPLGAVTRNNPELCTMMEAALAATSGLSIRERCERGAHPRCRFVVE